MAVKLNMLRRWTGKVCVQHRSDVVELTGSCRHPCSRILRDLQLLQQHVRR